MASTPQQDITRRRMVFVALILLLVAVPLGVMTYKLLALDYPLAELIPAVSYQTEISLQVDGHGEDIHISTYLPRSDARQIISEEQNSSGIFAMSLQTDADNRQASWDAENVQGQHTISRKRLWIN